MNTCYEMKGDLYSAIKLEQSANAKKIRNDESFRVSYGMQVRDGLSYRDAALELGSCIMHRAACDGDLNNETGEDAA